MDPLISLHNMHRESIDSFIKMDPQLRRLQRNTYVYSSPLLMKLPTSIPGIYTLSGGRQIGKTTVLKQWMLILLKQGIDPAAIIFLSGEMIDDHHTLLNLIQQQSQTMPHDSLHYMVIDEITYIKDWDKAIKYAADAGLLDNVILILTGSDIGLLRDARMRFPGRRGRADEVNFHLYPLSFCETLHLKKHTSIVKKIQTGESLSDKKMETLFSMFDQYLVHGGYLTAINDLAAESRILPATLSTYSDWVRGDMLKRGKQERYLKEILSAIQKRQGSQITWHSLARDLSIDHHKTVADYVTLLEDMEAVFIQSALLEDKLVAAPKKAKKIMFADPFIYHAIRAWLSPSLDTYGTQIQSSLQDPIFASCLVEACVATHYRRHYPTYYIKAEGEVDVAYIDANKFWPIEVKWTRQLHAKDLAQVIKYPRAKILTQMRRLGMIQAIPTEPLPVALVNLG